MTFLVLLPASSVFGALTLEISPAPGNPSNYLLTAEGDGVTVASSSNNGRLNFDGTIAFNSNGSPASGLTFGGVNVTVATPSVGGPYSQFYFQLNAPVTDGNFYGFSGGPILVNLGSSNSYEDVFIPGIYNITTSTGIFGELASGVLTINAVPEPRATTTLAVLSSFVAFMRRRRKEPR